MRSVYRVLAFVVAAEVVIQAAAIAFAVFGLGKWVEDGGTLNKATMESDDGSVGGAVGFMIHGINGLRVITLDYVRPPGVRTAINALWAIVGVVLFALGTVIVFSFNACVWPGISEALRKALHC